MVSNLFNFFSNVIFELKLTGTVLQKADFYQPGI